MNLKEFINIVGFFVKSALPEKIIDIINKSQLEHFLLLYMNKEWESLRPFSVVMDGHAIPLLHFTGGYADIPKDYFGNPDLTNETVRVNIVDDLTFDELRTHKIEYPTNEYPVGNLQSNFIRLLPKELRYLTFSYIAKPVPVVYGYTTTRGFIEYDPTTSTELKWNETNTILILQRVLQAYGVLASIEEIQSKQQQKQ